MLTLNVSLDIQNYLCIANFDDIFVDSSSYRVLKLEAGFYIVKYLINGLRGSAKLGCGGELFIGDYNPVCIDNSKFIKLGKGNFRVILSIEEWTNEKEIVCSLIR